MTTYYVMLTGPTPISTSFFGLMSFPRPWDFPFLFYTTIGVLIILPLPFGRWSIGATIEIWGIPILFGVFIDPPNSGSRSKSFLSSSIIELFENVNSFMNLLSSSFVLLLSYLWLLHFWEANCYSGEEKSVNLLNWDFSVTWSGGFGIFLRIDSRTKIGPWMIWLYTSSMFRLRICFAFFRISSSLVYLAGWFTFSSGVNREVRLSL